MTVYFDINRLVWGAFRASPSGIDRVATAYGRWLLETMPDGFRPVGVHRGRLYAIRKSRFRRILARAEATARTPAGDDARWAALAAALNAEKPAGLRLTAATQTWRDWPAVALAVSSSGSGIPLRLGPQDVYLNVTHSGLDDARLLPRLAARGARSVVMLHDLIPLTHPEYCAPGAAAKHAARLATITSASAVIANSQNTAETLATLCPAAPPVSVARLGVSDCFHPGVQPLRTTRPYFVCVGTIEARKNLTLLMSIWRRLAETLGEATPSLVLVGLRGWENEAVIDHLERSHAVRRLVHEVGSIGDERLASLMAGAAAVLAPSHAEGYDLPVMEAQALGVPVIASDIAVHRELASGVRLIDPLDGAGWLAAIGAALGKRTAGPKYDPPRWSGHFQLITAMLNGSTATADA